MENLIGDYVATKDVPAQMGCSAFIIPKGAIIAVKQYDKSNRNIIVEAGPRLIDWMHINFLNSFEKIDND